MFDKRAFVAILTAMLSQANGNFMGSRNTWKLIEGHFLKLNCRNPHHFDMIEWDQNSYIDLGDCYSNKKGELSLEKGDRYSTYGSCRGCNLEPDSLWLNCECQHDGKWARTRIDLNDGIDNYDGWPCCKNGVCSEELPS